MLLPDINVWLAMTFASHVHHSIAKTWFQGLAPGTNCTFCRLTQQGFLRIATNAKAFQSESLTLQEAWRVFDQLVADPKVGFAVESGDVEVHWRSFTQGQAYSTNVWSDAYLVPLPLRAA